MYDGEIVIEAIEICTTIREYDLDPITKIKQYFLVMVVFLPVCYMSYNFLVFVLTEFQI